MTLTRVAPGLFVLLWATGFIGSKMGAPYAEPFTFLALRFAVVAFLMALIAALWRARLPSPSQALSALWVGMLMHGVYLGAVFWAIDRGMPAGVAAVVVSLQPLTTAVLARVMLGEALPRQAMVGLVLGLFGVAMIILPKADFADAGIRPATLIAAVIGLIAFTFATIEQKRRLANIDLVSGSALQFAGAAVLMALGAFAFETRAVEWHPRFIFAFVWLIVVLSIGAVGLLLMMIRENAVSRVAALFYMVPAVTALIAWALFDETLSPIQGVGMAVVTIAVMLATRPAATQPAAAQR